MTNKYLEGLRREDNYTLTENAALTHKSTLSDLLDFFGTCGALRTRIENEIIRKFSKAFAEHPLYALKTLFYCRDIRQGQGERQTPRYILRWLAINNPDVLRKNLIHVPFYGRWDDLFVLKGTPLEKDLVRIVRNQLVDDSHSEQPSLLAKWMPSENSKSKKTKALGKWMCQQLELKPRSYRKTLVALRKKIKIVESYMCQNRWDDINYEHVPSRASMIYRKAFSKHNPERYQEYLASVEKGEKKINTGTLYPYDLLQKVWGWGKQYDQTVDLQWKNLPNYIPDGENGIVVADTSGSMSGLPILVSVSLAIYFAERNIGAWKDYFIMFSERPYLQQIKGNTIYEKVKNFDTVNAANTNIQAVFDLLLDTAKKYNIPQEEMLKTIYIISDMEFDVAEGSTQSYWSTRAVNKKTNFQMIKEKYQNAGYEMPKLVFWNVDSRNDQQPITIDDNGVYLVSGCSPSIFESIMKSKTITPIDLMLEVLNKERYARIQI